MITSTRPNRQAWHRRGPLLAVALLVLALLGLTGPTARAADASGRVLAGHRALQVTAAGHTPVVVPTPQSITVGERALRVPRSAVVVADGHTDGPAKDLLVRLLEQHGARSVEVVTPSQVRPRADQLVVLLGDADRSDVALGLRLGRTNAPDRAEGYGLAVISTPVANGVVIGGHDGDGQFYGVQTLRQLFQRSGQGWTIAGASVRDWPRMALRGTIEGFYGSPWSDADRLRQMIFQGDVKANTYVYSPKDDPYLRAEWRDPYPSGDLGTLTTLVDAALANHVAFTYALSPGVSICFSSAADRQALLDKLESVYAIGVRSFSLPFDDISYAQWNCDDDQAAYGDPGPGAAGVAQVSLLNAVTDAFVRTKGDVAPLQTVPTEYSDLADSPYKTEFREHLDPSVVIQWTGTDVVPPSITNADAATIEQVWGRKTFLWDNYPVNDYGQSAGRLLLAPYDGREAGLADHLQGIVSNPMNQQSASMIAEFGVADFAWNDQAYDAQRTWQQAFAYVAGGDQEAAAAIEVFADLEHAAPTFGPDFWQPQAPALARRVTAFEADWAAGHQARAIRDLRAYAIRIERAPAVIRGSATVDSGFVDDSAHWLTATRLWGAALVTQLDALEASRRGRPVTAAVLTRVADRYTARAASVYSDPDKNRWGRVPVQVGDGVLDTAVAEVRALTR